MNGHIVANLICLHFNYCIDIGEFPHKFKHADIIPLHKKKEKSNKTNYRTVSILLNLSKIHEKLIYNRLYDYFDKILFPSQCGFCKGYSSQHCLIAMLENFNKSAETFDCIDYKHLIAKLSCTKFHQQLLIQVTHTYLGKGLKR